MSRHGQETMWSDLRVGIITFAALVLLILGVVLAGGDKGLLFQKKSYVHALMTNVGGLKKGSSVTMSGMTVGKVTEIAFANGSEGSQIQVTMQVRADVLQKIKTDSVPSVRTQGMLGDRYVDISMGSNQAQALPADGILNGKSATDFDETLHQALGVLQET
ncbi:MAG: MCE family protein, partial [Candidatus Omnitrophica bacterium]|nr:MCE family protein [Candidatus Omnitrophota bacterium]